MTYDKRFIMKRAWEIKRENRMNVFALCLKMAWAEAKAAKVETFEEKVERLSRKYRRWTKYGKDRIYFSPEDLGLEIWHGKCWVDGQPVSRGAVDRMNSEKAYWDLKTRELVLGNTFDEVFGRKIRAEIA